MRLLILGGTEFAGRAVAEAALARGWQVTVFHRGRHAPPPGAAVLLGDRTRTGGLTALDHGEWDAVVDTWTGAPVAVRDAARLLAGRVDRYVYLSSRSVYAHPAPGPLSETSPLVEAAADAGPVGYPQAKRGGELAATEAFGDRALLVRAGLLLGPRENVGRLPWWLARVARGGPVLAPGPQDLPLQYLDARDLADWILGALDRGLGGPYNLVSPPGHTTMRELLDTCVSATGSRAELRWADPEPLLAAGVEPWTELPLWLPPGDLHRTFHGTDVAAAVATGLRCRPVADTVTDTWLWLEGQGGRIELRTDRPPVGLSAEREAAVLRSLE
ncbi:NAD-dependent epimerase/dehydratase family protein [Kitasatospora sp. LaBMicrA B282]|uniref:NAD-dependent epimerase/dehydratase family protein n=1 Tax=Kitasatospora sp. LaBMicrA B282 TaxID=3420949 RepID=UPI003D146521